MIRNSIPIMSSQTQADLLQSKPRSADSIDSPLTSPWSRSHRDVNTQSGADRRCTVIGIDGSIKSPLSRASHVYVINDTCCLPR
jgi:hypothetical protein